VSGAFSMLLRRVPEACGKLFGFLAIQC